MESYEFEMFERLTLAVERIAENLDAFYHDYGKDQGIPEPPRCSCHPHDVVYRGHEKDCPEHIAKEE
jgi:hypothetical protein